MQPQDDQALELAAWQAFLHRLGEHLAAQWPAMPERLGERYEDFVDVAVLQAAERGFGHLASIARLVNLWFVWGPAWHDKPGFEWAQGILAAPGEREWLKVHQLVRRSLVELQRLPGTRIEPEALARADERVQEVFAPLGRRGSLHRPQPEPLPRAACDLEAVELRLLDDGRQHEYRFDATAGWQRVPVALPAPLRIDAARPAPALVAALSDAPGQGPQARLQLRARTHAVCDGGLHPALSFSGAHGRWAWAGHETRAVSWPLAARDQPLPPPGPGGVIAEETSPEPYPLTLEVCGLRDEGDAVGSVKTMVSVWPAAQWWLEVQRAAPAAQALLPAGRAWARGVTRCRVERDGRPQDSVPLQQQFEQGLDVALAVGLHKLAAAWEAVGGLESPRLDAQLGLLVGKAACTWGWRFGAGGLDGRPLMRLVAAFEMDAGQGELQFGGELALAGTRTRLALRAAGQAPLRLQVRRETLQPPLLEQLLPAVARWRWPFELALEPLATETGSLLQLAGTPTGALVGEAGLRPGTKGHGGWEWYARLGVEPVGVALQVADPLLGQVSSVLPLLPALSLVDWSLG